MKPKPPKDMLKAARKGSREAEIGMYGHPLPKHKVHISKKQYIRAKAKARLKEGEPLLLPFAMFNYYRLQPKAQMVLTL